MLVFDTYNKCKKPYSEKVIIQKLSLSIQKVLAFNFYRKRVFTAYSTDLNSA